MSDEQLDDLTQPQRDRLAFVELRVRFIGDIRRQEAFLMQLERTNVAISRAMAKCLVVMPMTLAGHVPQDKKAIETAHAIKDYVDEFCNQELVDQVSFGSTSRQAKLRYHQ